ncbi:g6268 [Coccomyxa viridis]|uniref:G6268 protein n=1 Tax=Coccomyxa viridis TaxID=1274662 RepID=A0ABP1FXJ8_9CHLO
MSVRLPGKNFADVFLRLVWMLLFIPPAFWLKRDDAMAGNEARDMYLTLWTRTAGAAPAFGVSISTFVALVGDFMPFMPYTSRSFLHEPWTLADTVYLTLALAGVMLRLWAMRVFALHQLGKIRDHQLMQTGPYCLIRHPGHAGSIVGILGYAGFVGLRPPGLLWALVLVLPLSFFMARVIPYEEEILHQHFGQEWVNYCKRTWCLIPMHSRDLLSIRC